MSPQPASKNHPNGTSALSSVKADPQFEEARRRYHAGDFAGAEAIAQHLLQQDPGDAALLGMLGGIAQETGRHDEAITCFQRAILAAPQQAEWHYNLGLALQSAGQPDEAIKSYTRAAMLKPDYLKPNFAAAQLLHQLGQPQQALPYVIRACLADPTDYPSWHLYAAIQNGLPLFAQEQHLREPLLAMLNKGFSNHIPACIIRQLQLTDWLRALQQLLGQHRLDEIDRLLARPDMLQAMNDPLLLTLMRRGVVNNILLEITLTRLRRQLALNRELAESAEARPLLLGLWAQGFLNEYVCDFDAEEQAQIQLLRASVAQTLAHRQAPDAVALALLGSYVPLWKEDFAAALAEWRSDDPQIDARIREQIREPLADRAYIAAIAQLTPIEDEVTRKVRAQYEENPYPRWNELPDFAPIDLEQYLQRGLIQHNWKALPPEPLEIMIAGCGTGQHAAIIGRILPNAKILAIDISLASLAYAKRKAEQFGITNIEFLQADILTLDRLDRDFDLIESIGVLHHMHDPMAGWRMLNRLLRPGGLMKIGLYSQTARAPISLAREEIATRQLGHSDTAIRQYRQELIRRVMDSHKQQEQSDNKLTPQLARIFMGVDFYSLSNCRDLLFHVQEHQFTLPQIEACIAELGLDFLGLDIDKSSKMAVLQKSLPAADRSTDLEQWHRYEQQNPTTFHGMYHFWLQKPRG